MEACFMTKVLDINRAGVGSSLVLSWKVAQPAHFGLLAFPVGLRTTPKIQCQHTALRVVYCSFGGT